MFPYYFFIKNVMFMAFVVCLVTVFLSASFTCIATLTKKLFNFQNIHINYPLAQQSCGRDIGSVPYVCM